MIKLLKAGFWFGLVLYFLPLGEETKAPLRELTTVDAVLAASNAASEIRAFCTRRPDLCDAGTAALERAASASEIDEPVQERFGADNEDALTVEDIIAGGVDSETAQQP